MKPNNSFNKQTKQLKMKIGTHLFKLKNKQQQQQLQTTFKQVDDIQLMKNNLLKIKKQLTQPEQQCIQQNQQHQFSQKYSQNNQKQEYISPRQNLINIYQEYLQKNKFSQNFSNKINQLLDQKDGMCIGNTIALFQMVYHFRQVLTTQVLQEIQQKAFLKFTQLYQRKNDNEQQDKQLVKECLIQLIAVCRTPSQQIIQFFVQYLLQNLTQFESAYKVLVNMDMIGIGTLIKIIDQDFEDVSQKILSYLSRNQIIINQIIVPILANDLLTKSYKQKNISLAILNRLGPKIYSQKLLQIFFSLFKSNNVDKQLLISTIKNVGCEQGQKILLSLLQNPSLNQQIGVFIIKILSQTIQSKVNKQIFRINIETMQFSMSDLTEINKIYVYQGKIRPLFRNQNVEDRLYINSRSLTSLLQQFLQNQEQIHLNSIHSIQFQEGFILPSIILHQQNSPIINFNLLNSLSQIIYKNNNKIKLKEAALQAFGSLQIPQQRFDLIEKICTCLWSQDASIKSMACLTLSKIEFQPSSKVIKRFSQLLRDNFWKVRISICQAIGSLIHQPVQSIIQNLIKCLKDGSINRQLVCKTLLKINHICQDLLLQFLRTTKDQKIQQSILCSFNSPKILQSQNFGDILQTLFRFSNHKKKQIRYICLQVVNDLRQQASDDQIDIQYFKPKNILPFFYNFLDDSCNEIREQALRRIIQFGSHADLVLIEGMTKGKSMCKIQCVKGLAIRGVQNFRALILGMRDSNEKVKNQCARLILQKFLVQQIVQYYKEQNTQCISLIYNIRDLIEKDQKIDYEVRIFLEEIIRKLLKQCQFFEQSINDEIQNQINQYRESIKMRKQKNQLQQNQINNTQNIDPNIRQALNEIKSYKLIQDSNKISDEKTKQINNPKKYYFKFNQHIQIRS